MLNNIKESKELLEIFDDQCLIWWNKKGLINIIYDIIVKYFDKSSNNIHIIYLFNLKCQYKVYWIDQKNAVELLTCMFGEDDLKQNLISKFSTLYYIYSCTRRYCKSCKYYYGEHLTGTEKP